MAATPAPLVAKLQEVSGTKEDLLVAYLLDGSGSMANDFEKLREALMVLLDRVGPNVMTEVLQFSITTQIVCPWTKDLGHIKRSCQKPIPRTKDSAGQPGMALLGGGTNMKTAFEELLVSFMRVVTEASRPVVVFITDGVANEDPRKEINKFLRMTPRPTVIGVGVGSGTSQDVLEKLLPNQPVFMVADFAKLVTMLSSMAKTESPVQKQPSVSVAAPSASSFVAHEARGPLSEANACHAAFETAAARSDDLGKAAVRAQRELEAAADAAAEAVRKVDGERAAVADLEQRLSERRRALAAAEGYAAQTEQRRAAAAEKSRRALAEAQRAEEAMRKAQKALEKAGRRAAELSSTLSRRDVSVLSVHDVSDVLRELGLSEHVVAAFEANEIDGDVLCTLSYEDLSKLGLSDSASRQRLRHAVSTVDACGQLRLAGVALERIAARAGSDGERDAVLIAGWDAERVGRWLELQKTPENVREKLAAGGVTGERLLHTDDAELERLGIKAMGARNKLVRQIDAIRKSHFDALRSFFGSRSSSSSTGAAAAVASPAPSVSSFSSKAATGAAGEGSGSTSVVGDGGSGSEGVPGLFVCPISLEVMERPVVAADGFVYERTAIEQWLRTQQKRKQPTTSPMTNAPMAAEPLVQLNTLRSEIIAWKQHHHRH